MLKKMAWGNLVGEVDPIGMEMFMKENGWMGIYRERASMWLLMAKLIRVTFAMIIIMELTA